MKALHLIHLAVTVVLLAALIVFSALFLVGVIGVRVPDKNPPALEIGPSKSKFRLVVVRGLKPNLEYPIWDGPNVIGRADKQPVDIDLTFQEPEDRIWTSRQHAVVTCEKGSLFVEDLNSSNGTYVNRRQVRPGQKQPLQANDIIQIGETHLKVQ